MWQLCTLVKFAFARNCGAMFPKHPQPVAPRREVATMVARQRQDGAGPVDTKVIVMERPQKKPPSTKIESS